MCRRITCETCSKPSWIGCGLHVESEEVLGLVPLLERCQCKRNNFSTRDSVFGGGQCSDSGRAKLPNVLMKVKEKRRRSLSFCREKCCRSINIDSSVVSSVFNNVIITTCMCTLGIYNRANDEYACGFSNYKIE